MNSVGDDKNLAAISFEDALRELEAIVTSLERGMYHLMMGLPHLSEGPHSRHIVKSGLKRRG